VVIELIKETCELYVFKKGAKVYVSKPTINGISKNNFGNRVDCQMTAEQREIFTNS
jgi:hypothetical protein